MSLAITPEQEQLRFMDQARIQPRAYLAGVAKAFITLGGRIYEHSSADDFCDDPRAVKVAGHTVRGDDIVIGTYVDAGGGHSGADNVFFWCSEGMLQGSAVGWHTHLTNR